MPQHGRGHSEVVMLKLWVSTTRSGISVVHVPYRSRDVRTPLEI